MIKTLLTILAVFYVLYRLLIFACNKYFNLPDIRDSFYDVLSEEYGQDDITEEDIDILIHTTITQLCNIYLIGVPVIILIYTLIKY